MKPVYFVVLLFVVFVLGGCADNSPAKNENEEIQHSSIEELDKQIVEDPRNGDLYDQRARYHLRKNDPNTALSNINKALQIDSLNVQYLLTLADIYLAKNELSSSLEALQKADDLDPENNKVKIQQAELYLIIRDYKNVAELTNEVLATDKIYPQAYFIRGFGMMEQGDTAAAVRNFITAIEQDQDYFDAYMQLGLIYSFKGDVLAEEYYKNAIRIQADNITALYYLGFYYQETEQIDKAIEEYNKAISIDPDFITAHYNLGYIQLVYFNNFEQAIQHFSDAISIENSYTDAWFNRGYCYELMKDYENARMNYKKALELETNYERAIIGLNRLDKRQKL